MNDSAAQWPRPLQPATGPFRPDKIDGALLGMGDYGDATRALGAKGLLQPDMITGMTLFLIANQPRPASSGAKGEGASSSNGVSGGVWVRERFTIHAPVDRNDPFTVTGEATGTGVRKGRRYSTTSSVSVNAAGERIASNLTTGLLTYRADPDLADSHDGIPTEDTRAPEADWAAASHNPHLDVLRSASVGDVHGGEAVHLSLEMMAARDTENPDNPIHSDIEAAKKTGLKRPIAGGSHVLAMPLEAIMRSFGPEALLHGAFFDVRWKAPAEDGVDLLPSATVAATGPDEAARDRLVFDLKVDLVGGPTAMVGTVVVPTR